ncbi:MAG: hypothetical protein AAF677_11650 [Pseudomonadota bacterium]
MPLQNRVTPDGSLVAAPWRGALMGNRGILHDAEGRIGRRAWTHRAWVACALSFRDRWRPPMPPGRYTALFFWDEAAAFAAGHLPCGECRRADFRRFAEAWTAGGQPGTSALERHRALHAARVRRDRSRVTVRCDAAMLADGGSDGAFVLVEGGPGLVWHGALHPWRAAGGYGPPVPLPSGAITLLTPLPALAAFRAGYRPAVRLG